MKNRITTAVMILLVALITLGGNTSCKSKKRVAREAAEAEYNARVAEAVRDLNAILNDQTTWTLEEKENRVQTIKDWNLQNAEVDALLLQVERKLARERAQAAQNAEAERLAAEAAARANEPKNLLTNAFNGIVNATSVTQANRLISETLQMFASNDVPVLIIISQAGGPDNIDYDRPTTIENYLNYLKDQHVNRNDVYELKFNEAGKITEVELLKR